MSLSVSANHSGIQGVNEDDDDAMQTLVGMRYIDVQLQDISGKPHMLSEYIGKGKWVLIDFLDNSFLLSITSDTHKNEQ